MAFPLFGPRPVFGSSEEAQPIEPITETGTCASPERIASLLTADKADENQNETGEPEGGRSLTWMFAGSLFNQPNNLRRRDRSLPGAHPSGSAIYLPCRSDQNSREGGDRRRRACPPGPGAQPVSCPDGRSLGSGAGPLP